MSNRLYIAVVIYASKYAVCVAEDVKAKKPGYCTVLTKKSALSLGKSNKESFIQKKCWETLTAIFSMDIKP